MKRTFDTPIASLLAISFIVFLGFLGTNASLSFDASYNLLSYQNLFNGKGFIYDYDGRRMPFDPGITTGPELYLPVFLIWKIIGHTDYHISVYVVIAYYALFLGFLIFYALKPSKTKTISILGFILLFLCTRPIFENYLAVMPLGEIPACFLIFSGIYLLNKKKLVAGFMLLGLALDLKFNTVVALIPTAAIFILLEFITPKLREKNVKEAYKIALKLTILSLLIFVPYVVHTRIIPSIVLNHDENKILKTAQKERFRYEKNRAFGQIRDLKKNFNKEGFRRFVSHSREKFSALKSWHGESWLLLALFGFLLIYLTLFSYYEKHFSFYLFIFSLIVAVWWLLAPIDIWYRYFLPAQFMFLLGIVSLIQVLIEKKKRVASICISFAVIMLFVPQFSFSAVKKNLNGTDKENLMMMKDYIQGIDEQNIFAYGWFQCPQLMLLTNKRFQDYTDTEKVFEAKREGREIFFLTTVESIHHIKDEMEAVTRDFELIKAFGYNRLYRIRY